LKCISVIDNGFYFLILKQMRVYFDKDKLEKLLRQYSHKSGIRYIDCLDTMFNNNSNWYIAKKRGYLSYKQYLMLEEIIGEQVRACKISM
jgi:hypothetical protein